MVRVLEGVRVIDFSFRLNGSYCSLLLGDMGAEVIRIDRTRMPPELIQLQQEILIPTGRNKKSITLNLRTERGQEIFARLAKQSDVIVSTYLPDAAKRLGIDYETVERINSNIVYCSLTGYGQDGPYRDRPSHDVDCLGISGVLGIPGSLVELPSKPGIALATLSSNVFAFATILAALLVRPKIGRGQFIDVGAADVLFSWASVRAAEYMLKGTLPGIEEWGHISAASDVFPTKDGKRIVLALVDDGLWRNFCDAVGRPDLVKDEHFSNNSKRRENWKELHTTLEELMISKTRDEWNEILSNKEIAFSPVNEINEAFDDPHFNYRGLIQELNYPGIGQIKQVAFPAKFSQTPADIRTPPPSPGQDTEDILRSLGYSTEEIAEFHPTGVI